MELGGNGCFSAVSGFPHLGVQVAANVRGHGGPVPGGEDEGSQDWETVVRREIQRDDPPLCAVGGRHDCGDAAARNDNGLGGHGVGLRDQDSDPALWAPTRAWPGSRGNDATGGEEASPDPCVLRCPMKLLDAGYVATAEEIQEGHAFPDALRGLRADHPADVPGSKPKRGIAEPTSRGKVDESGVPEKGGPPTAGRGRAPVEGEEEAGGRGDATGQSGAPKGGEKGGAARAPLAGTGVRQRRLEGRAAQGVPQADLHGGGGRGSAHPSGRGGRRRGWSGGGEGNIDNANDGASGGRGDGAQTSQNEAGAWRRRGEGVPLEVPAPPRVFGGGTPRAGETRSPAGAAARPLTAPFFFLPGPDSAASGAGQRGTRGRRRGRLGLAAA